MTEQNKDKEEASHGIEELKNNKYGTSAKNGAGADNYTETTKAVAYYTGRVYGKDMKMLVLHLEEANFEEPEYPDKAVVVLLSQRRQEEL